MLLIDQILDHFVPHSVYYSVLLPICMVAMAV
jgi:hypothetical protein